MLWIAALAGALLSAGPQVELETLTGQKLSGALTRLSSDQLELQTDDGLQQFDPAELLVCTFPHEPASTTSPPALWVELVDGAFLPASRYEAQQGTAHIYRGDTHFELSTSLVNAVRFGPRTPATIEQWNQLLANRPAGDLVIVRKATNLDYLEGILRRVTPDIVEFEVDGETLPVKITKLDGIVYHHPAAGPLRTALARLTTRDGASLVAATVELNDSTATFTTPAGATLHWPLEELQRIDFSQGKVVYLSDLAWDPRRSSWEPYFGRADQVGPLAEFYQPRRDVGYSGEPLRLDGQTFRRGLALRSRSNVVYRLPDNFRRLAAVVGIDDSMGDAGHVQFRVLGDGRALFETTLAGSDQPVPLQLDIVGVRDLQFVVEFGDDLDVADCLTLGDARVIK